MSKERYDALPEQARAAIDQIKGEWYTTELGRNMDAQTAEVTARLQAAGDHQFIELSDADLAKAAEVLGEITQKWEGKSDKNPEILTAARTALGK